MKIDKRKKYNLIIDVEGTMKQSVYDIGCGIFDKKGNCYASLNLVISDTFYGKPQEMATSYYAEKIPQYVAEIENNTRRVVTIQEAQQFVLQMCGLFQVKNVYAYNAGYDKTALAKTLGRDFFPYQIKWGCIWNMAAQTICATKSFLRSCTLTEKGNPQTGAEAVYRYLSGVSDFKEEHTGLRDVLVENAILAYVFRYHKKLDTAIKGNVWRVVKNNYDELIGAA